MTGGRGNATGGVLGEDSGSQITDLSINNQTTVISSAGGVIPGTVLAGGSPRPSVGIVRMRDARGNGHL
jgi:hypothetical protein